MTKLSWKMEGKHRHTLLVVIVLQSLAITTSASTTTSMVRKHFNSSDSFSWNYMFFCVFRLTTSKLLLLCYIYLVLFCSLPIFFHDQYLILWLFESQHQTIDRKYWLKWIIFSLFFRCFLLRVRNRFCFCTLVRKLL